MEETKSSPWICHICEGKFQGGESIACSRCFKIACAAHLRHIPTRSPQSGLYVLEPVCIACAALGTD